MSLRSRCSQFLSRKSVVRYRKYPNPTNSWIALFYVLISVPLALLLLPFFLVYVALKRQLSITVLATDDEFGPFMHLMEHLRGQDMSASDCVFVLSSKRHQTFAELYRRELATPILWGQGYVRLLQQAILLQPSFLVKSRLLTPVIANEMCSKNVEVPNELLNEGGKLLKRIGLSRDRYVAMAVHTSSYDETENDRYALQERARETIGSELVEGVDYLRSSGVGVVLLGSADTGKSHIPRSIPRLHEFGKHGGVAEVAVVSGCKYFWTDDVGAWWLAVPFGKPILFTNFSRILIRNGIQPRGHLVVPARYESLHGKRLSFRDLLESRSPTYKAAARGKLVMIRNSSEEIVEAHREMIARVSGLWREDDEAREQREQLERIFGDFPEWHPLSVASSFLKRYPYLLD